MGLLEAKAGPSAPPLPQGGISGRAGRVGAPCARRAFRSGSLWGPCALADGRRLSTRFIARDLAISPVFFSPQWKKIDNLDHNSFVQNDFSGGEEGGKKRRKNELQKSVHVQFEGEEDDCNNRILHSCAFLLFVLKNLFKVIF